MSLLFDKMKEELQKQTIQITETITTTVLNTLDEKLQPIIKENKELKREVEELNKKINNMDLNARKNNIIIHGIPETNDEKVDDLTTLVIKTINKLDVPLENWEINKVQRLGKQANIGKIRPILLATTTLQKKILILRNKMKMQKGTYITQDYSKETMQKRKANPTKPNKPRENEKRKRIPETPSPNGKSVAPNNKLHKIDAFRLMRERSCSTPGKYTNSNN